MDLTKLKIAQKWSANDILFCLQVSEKSDKLWFGSSDAGVYEFDLSSEKPERQAFEGEGHRSYVTGMARVDNLLVTGSYDQQLIWWDLETRQQKRAIAAHDRWIRRVIVTPKSQVISVADDMRCRVWDPQSGERIADFSDHAEMTPHHYPSMLYAVASSSDGEQIATGDRIGHVAIWDANRFEKTSELNAPEMYTWDPKQRRHSIGGIRSLAFSPDGTKLAVGGMGQVGNIDHLGGSSRLEVFDLASGEQLFVAEDSKNQGLIEHIAWSSDGSRIIAAGGGEKGLLSIHDADSGEQLHVTDDATHVHAIHVDEATETILAVAHQRIIQWSFAAEA